MTEKLTFIDHLVSREHRFSIGVLGATGEKYLSIPVTNPRVDYEEYYRIETMPCSTTSPKTRAMPCHLSSAVGKGGKIPA